MRYFKVFIVLLVALVLAGCADNVAYTVTDPTAHVYGFWGGVWHGFIVFWNLIMMIFYDDVTIYAPSNSGGWYAFGYWIGLVVCGYGASSARS
jgi:hypothetical protein